MPRAIVLMLALSIARAQDSGSWKDPSKHKQQFVTVEPGVQIEVLDWGGSGRAVVLLTGSGNTAHVYDDFAPKLADCCRVYALTRRGFGHSSHPASGYDDQRLADDVFQVIDSLKIRAPFVVGHSMAGGELTTLGNQHSDRLSGLVYLDAGADPKDFPWSDPAYREAVKRSASLAPAKPSTMQPDRKKSYQAYRAWQMEREGWAFCEAEVRNMYYFNSDGSIGANRGPANVNVGQLIDQGTKKRDYSRIRVPLLAIFATPPPPAKRENKDPEYQAAAKAEYGILMSFIGRYEKSVAAVPGARVLDWPGASHYVFLSNEADVLRELHAFVAGLR